MRVGVLTREYPPDVYGGAGVHVEFLVRELRKLIDVDVHCWGEPRTEPGVYSYRTPAALATANAAVQTLGISVEMAAAVGGLDLLHSHTWYANLAGVVGGTLNGIPHVLSAHSLEPARPWKAEQLGGGYRISSWAERQGYEQADGIIAVSRGTRDDILHYYPFVDPAKVHVIYNGIDTSLYRPTQDPDVLERYGIDPDRPSVIFVGRITRQKGLVHLLKAAASFDPAIQLILCAGQPDTPEIAEETTALTEALQASRTGVVWIQQMLPRPEVIALLSSATVFVCPSVYEPLGIVNLEAAACETAVVASDVGGIPEVVADGETGILVHYDESEPDGLSAGLTEAINQLCADPDRAAALGKAGRERAVRDFSWDQIARQTVELYQSLL
jgi:alpha-maltose-1-phosphate synthase